MRIQLKFSSATKLVPNNLAHVVRYIHKCLGDNNVYHDKPSDYVISRMTGGSIVDGGRFIEYPDGGSIFISSGDQDILNKIVAGATTNKSFGFGMNLIGLDFVQEELFDGFNVFKTTNTGVLLKKRDGQRYSFHTLEEEGFEQTLTEHTKKRLSKIDKTLSFKDFKIELQESDKNKTRGIVMSSSKSPEKVSVNQGNVCSVIVYCNKQVAQAIHDYGLGQSTGIGFGMVMNITNSKTYS